VKVAGHDELNKKVVLSPTGIFSYSLISDFKATGCTLHELTRRTQEKLKEFILNASVDIRRLHLVKALGDVQSAGQYEFDHPPTMLDVLAASGGFAQLDMQYNTYRARILTDDGAWYDLDVTKLLTSGEGNDAIRLFHGDTFVLEPDKRDQVYVLGAVSNAVMWRSGMRILDALILSRTMSRTAGGGTLSDEPTVNIKNVRILRRCKDGRTTKIEINLHDIIHRNRVDRNIELEPGDYVVVPRRSQRNDFLTVLKNIVAPVTQTVGLLRIF